MLTTTFNYLCTNFNKKPGSPDQKEKYSQFTDRFGRIDNEVFDQAIKLLCDHEEYFPKISTVLKYIAKVSPDKVEEFKYCPRCKGSGRVGLILAIKRHRDKDKRLSGRRDIVHRELWSLARVQTLSEDLDMKKHREDPDTFFSEQSAFCRCDKGRHHYDACGSNGLKLSQLEFMVE